MIADMATEIEAARLLVYQAAALLDIKWCKQKTCKQIFSNG
jgi:alkylation response protein AidB-like acyl-CoA dehydrogenase